MYNLRHSSAEYTLGHGLSSLCLECDDAFRDGDYSATNPSSLDLRHNPIPIRQARRCRVSKSRILCLSRGAGREETHVRHDIVAQSELRRWNVSTTGRSQALVWCRRLTGSTARKRFFTELT